MRYETTDEDPLTFPPPASYPSPMSTPVLALAVAALLGLSAFYAGHVRGNLLEELEKDHRTDSFEHLIHRSKLGANFQENVWQYTVIAPTDAAFSKALQTQDASAAVSHEPEITQRDISAYDYVLDKPIYPNDIKVGETLRVPTLSGHELVFTRVDEGKDGLRINGLPVDALRTANNGIIYFIDDVLPGPTQQLSWSEPRKRR